MKVWKFLIQWKSAEHFGADYKPLIDKMWRHNKEKLSALLDLGEGSPPVNAKLPSQTIIIDEFWYFSNRKPEKAIEQALRLPMIWLAITRDVTVLSNYDSDIYLTWPVVALPDVVEQDVHHFR